MKDKIKKAYCCLPDSLRNFFSMIFESAAENQLRIGKNSNRKFRSFTQLKNYQRKIRHIAMGFVGSGILLFLGILIGPIFFPSLNESQVYIPNGKGDIVIGNISKNQVSIIFKTLDSANGNIPLATSAMVEVFIDEEMKNKVKETVWDEYAVTHIIPITGLSEEKFYYFRIFAKDASSSENIKMVSSFGGGYDPIKAYTSGENLSKCFSEKDIEREVTKKVAEVFEDKIEEKNKYKNIKIVPIIENDINEEVNKDAFFISDVQNENHLYAYSKIQTIISWKTNKPGTTALLYHEGSDGEEKELIVDNEMKTNHVIIMTNLKTETSYYFKVKSIDENKKDYLSDEYAIYTPKAEHTIVERIADNFKAIIKQIKP